jgi:hypothetical protein
VVEVDALTLTDAISLARTERVELVKMDIEGEEVAVLRDATPDVLQRIVQLTVEFHDFLDSTNAAAIGDVIKKMKNLGFLAIKFSWHTYGDFLFVNREHAPLTLGQRTGLIVVHKYGRGIGRIANRAWQHVNHSLR